MLNVHTEMKGDGRFIVKYLRSLREARWEIVVVTQGFCNIIFEFSSFQTN